MIAYDLDGVICPDIHMPWQEKDFDFDLLFSIRDKLPPIFIPRGDFYIITGRPLMDQEHTEAWLKRSNVHPIKVIYNTATDPNELNKVAEHKAKHFNLIESLKVFVESDPNQVNIIKSLAHSHKKVYHFSDFVTQGIYESLFRLSNV